MLTRTNQNQSYYNMDANAKIFENKDYKKPIQLDEVVQGLQEQQNYMKFQEY